MQACLVECIHGRLEALELRVRRAQPVLETTMFTVFEI